MIHGSNGFCKYDGDIGFLAIGDKTLGTAQFIIITAIFGKAGYCSCIRTGTRLSQAETTHMLTGGEIWQIFALLTLRAKIENRGVGKRVVSRD